MVMYQTYYDKPLEYEDILYETEGKIAHITLNRPNKMNALRHQLRAELFHALRVAEADSAISVIIIKGAGRCFSAGYELGDGNDGFALPDVGPRFGGPGQWPKHLNAGYSLIWDLEKVVIAQAHGYCLAGGSELASFCDLFVVADDLQIGYPPVRDMSPPDNLWFPWHLQMRKAKEMLFTGDSISGKEAVEFGLANYSVPVAELDAFTKGLAERVAKIPADLLALHKRQINRTYEIMGIKTALAVSNDMEAFTMFLPHARKFFETAKEKGLKAALDRRDENFQDYGVASDKEASGA
jgi:enoyl-CoA hydratase